MKLELTKIRMINFKSIRNLEIDVKKYNGSYTRMLLGVNGVGKSNILQAMSYLSHSESRDEDKFIDINNSKNENGEQVVINFSLEFADKDTLIKIIREILKRNMPIKEGAELVKFGINEICKTVFLSRDEIGFKEAIHCNLYVISEDLFVKVDENNQALFPIVITKDNNGDGRFEPLTDTVFRNLFDAPIKEVIEALCPRALSWKPTEDYLISESVRLDEFRNDLSSNVPLKNIFILAGFDTDEKIQRRIDDISGNDQLRSSLASKLTSDVNKHIQKIWRYAVSPKNDKHSIDIVFEIDHTSLLTVSIKDGGESNKHDRHNMNVASDGTKQFLSIILSLSVDSRKSGIEKNLILIDEPELHLHPSAIRELMEELLKIGKNNYLFVATHSPFLVDKNNPARNVVVTKNRKAETQGEAVSPDEDIMDDAVLNEAFGINAFKDLLRQHKILVEGSTDRKILMKAFKFRKDGLDARIDAGEGSKIVELASLYKYHKIDILVITDDDDEGKGYKEKIIRKGGGYKEGKNVFTIKDLVECEGLPELATIEDCLGHEYVKDKFKEFYKVEFGEELTNDKTDPKDAIVHQIRGLLNCERQKQGITTKEVNRFMGELKVKIAEGLDLSKPDLFPLLNALCDAISEKVSQNIN